MKFIKFVLIWISQQLAIPFWMVGHIHLSMNMSIYDDVKILLASLGMNVLVAIGFWLDWRQWSAEKIDHTHILQKKINKNEKSINKTAGTLNRVMDEINQMKVYK